MRMYCHAAIICSHTHDSFYISTHALNYFNEDKKKLSTHAASTVIQNVRYVKKNTTTTTVKPLAQMMTTQRQQQKLK